MTIAIVHIPKAAGTSLKQAIAERVGADNIVSDYNSPLAQGDLHRNLRCIVSSCCFRPTESAVIFGHFVVGKYARYTGSRFSKRKGLEYVIFLRDPLQRAVSHYYFWKRTYVGGHTVWEQFTRENWSLEQFLLSRQHTNFQSKFIWRFPLRQFDFIGLTEHYNDSVAMLGRTFPILKDLPIKSEKCNPEKTSSADYCVDANLAREFKQHNKVDYTLYADAVQRFEEQKSRLLGNGCHR